MTDLRDMSLDELIALSNDCVEFISRQSHSPSRTVSLIREMARRLREQEEEASEYDRVLINTRNMATESLAKMKERAEQAESVLLACQAECADMILSIKIARSSCIGSQDYADKYCKNLVGDFSSIICRLDDALSPSTGSKIMAVVEAAKAEGKYIESFIAVGIPAQPVQIKLLETLHALEDK